MSPGSLCRVKTERGWTHVTSWMEPRSVGGRVASVLIEVDEFILVLAVDKNEYGDVFAVSSRGTFGWILDASEKIFAIG